MPGGIALEGQLNIYSQVSRIFGHAKFRNGQEEVIVVRKTFNTRCLFFQLEEER